MARTRISNIARTFKPNTASLGYALFLAINAAGVWGGVFPFLPMNFQTPEVMFWFFLMQSLVFSLCYFASAVGVYYFPGPTRRFMVMLASAPYLLGWCCLIGAIYLRGIAQPLVIAGGSLLGLGSAGFYMLWQRLFASFDADHGNHDLILGTAYGALLYFALYAIPQAVTAFLIPLVFMPLFALAIVLKSRQIDLRQPMFEDVPREHPQVYRRVLRDYWRSALCVGAIAFCTGVMRSLAIGDPRVGSLVNLLSMTGCLVAGVGVLVLWQFKNVRMNVTNAYRIAFPLLITSFLVLPFFSGGYAAFLQEADDALRRRARLLSRPQRFFIGCKVEVALIGKNPVHQHLHAGCPAGVSAVLPQRGNLDQYIRFRNGTVVGTLRLRRAAENQRRQEQRGKRSVFLCPHALPLSLFFCFDILTRLYRKFPLLYTKKSGKTAEFRRRQTAAQRPSDKKRPAYRPAYRAV